MPNLCGTAKFEITLDPWHPSPSNFPLEGGMIEVHLAVKLAGDILVNMIQGIVTGSILLEEVEKVESDWGPRWIVSFSFSIPNIGTSGSPVLAQFQPANQRRTKRITLDSEGAFVSLKDMV